MQNLLSNQSQIVLDFLCFIQKIGFVILCRDNNFIYGHWALSSCDHCSSSEGCSLAPNDKKSQFSLQINIHTICDFKLLTQLKGEVETNVS